jgi:hypothetical protein
MFPCALIAALGFSLTVQTVTGAETVAQLERAGPREAQGSHMQSQEIPVAVFDPTRQSPAEMMWQPYPAPPPAGFHWQHTGSPALKLDPATGRPLPGQPAGSWILVRDGYSMPKVR